MARPPLSASAAAVRVSVFAQLAPHIEAAVRRGGALVPLHIGDTHRAPPDASFFEEALGGRGDLALYRYGPLGGTPELIEAAARSLRAKGRAFAEVDSRHLLVCAGATHALFCGARAVMDAGDEVIVPSPYWPLSVGVFRACGARPVEVPLSSRLYADPSLDPADLLAEAVTPRTRALYLTTPNNPDGFVLSRAQLASVARLACERALWVIADEVYADYAYTGEHISIASLPGMAERTLTAFSLSKSHALAGARVGFLAGPEDAVGLARPIATHTVFNVPVVAQRAAARALTHGEPWLAAARAEYQNARDTALAALAGTGAITNAPAGGSYLFIDFGPLLGGRAPVSLLETLIDHGVLVAPGDAFGAGFETSARLCFTAVPRRALDDALARLRAAFEAFARG